ncbi:hypothetical protein AB0J90_29705 [Micromonospora sp. NPDC049523]|uniref:hypothetical protein n=1 Tax=Micromonospora sp. NPDC049523 TaxID=3155921 RepID=UPI003415B9AB
MTESHTVVLAAVTEPPPVFVDTTGRRRRFVRYFAYGVGGLALTYTALVGVSLAGGPVNPGSVLPFAELVGRPQPPLPNPVPTAPADATPTAQPSTSGGSAVPDRSVRPSGTATGTPARTATATGGPTVTPPGATAPDPHPPVIPVVPVEPTPAVPEPPTEPDPTPPTVTEPTGEPLTDPVAESAA